MAESKTSETKTENPPVSSKETKSADVPTSETKTKSKGLPTCAIIGIGCLGLLVLIGIGLTIAGKVIFSNVGLNILKKGIETKTGLKVDTGSNGENFSIVDSKTGEGIKVGDNSMPKNFPKDFPIYPGSKPTGSMSGNSKEDGQGFWVVLTTNDAINKVNEYYETNLKKQGWSTDQTMTIGDSYTAGVTKGSLKGSVVISRPEDAKETSIMISLSEELKSETKTQTNVSEEPISDEPVSDMEVTQ